MNGAFDDDTEQVLKATPAGELADRMQLHMTSASYPDLASLQTPNGGKYVAGDEAGSRVPISTENGVPTVGGARVIGKPMITTNGTRVYPIDRYIRPTDTPGAPVMSAIKAEPRYTKFLQTADKAGLAPVLKDLRGGTVFIPVDASFDGDTEALVASMSGPELADQMKLHVSGEDYPTPASLVRAGQYVASDKAGTKVPVTSDKAGRPVIGNSRVVGQPILTAEGVRIYPVDRYVRPSDVPDAAASSRPADSGVTGALKDHPRYSKFLAALDNTGLSPTLASMRGGTVFVPVWGDVLGVRPL